MENRRRNTVVAIVIAIIVILLLLLWRCSPAKQPEPTAGATAPAPESQSAATAESAQPEYAPAPSGPPEILIEATVEAPPEIGAGAAFEVTWTGPANEGDYITIVPVDAPSMNYGNYRLTREGSPLRLTAPIDPGECEVRYVTAKSRTVLGRTKATVVAASATLRAPASVTLDTPLSIEWTGPDNNGDYVTIVAAGTPDGKYGPYTTTDRGSPLKIIAPPDAGAAEIRYVTGQGARVLARRPLAITVPEVSLDAPAQVIAGAHVEVKWTGPGNSGDYITAVPAGTRDGEYKNYITVTKGPVVRLLMPMDPGSHELRYMTGRGARVLGRKPIVVVAAAVSLDAPAAAAGGSQVSIAWSGPANQGDYITIVPAGTPDGNYAAYTTANRGSPLTVKAPAAAGDAEIRYVSGQGARTLARRAIRITE